MRCLPFRHKWKFHLRPVQAGMPVIRLFHMCLLSLEWAAAGFDYTGRRTCRVCGKRKS